MKKYTSAASLAIRLTRRNVLIIFGLVGLCQWFDFLYQGWEKPYTRAFEYLLDDFPALMGNIGMPALAGVLYFALSEQKGSKSAYTLRRLQLGEGVLTAVFALVFSGYFLLYWAFQIGMILLLYAMYAGNTDVGQNLLFVSAFRSEYFHCLLPLYEPWAVARNALLCLCFGSFAALGAQNSRNGRTLPLLLFFVTVIWWVILYPHEMASVNGDISLIIIALVCLAADLFRTWRWMRNETN